MVSIEESNDDPSDGEHAKNENSNREVTSVEEKEMDEIFVGSGHEEEKQISDKANDQQKDVVNETNEIYVDIVENVLTCVQTESEERVDAAPNMHVINTVDERKNPEKTIEGMPTNEESLVASGRGILENKLDNLANHEETNKLIAKEQIDNGKECVTENASIADAFKEVPAKGNRHKKKVLKKKVIKKKMVLGHATAATSETKQKPSDGNEAPGEAFKVDRNEHTSNVEKAERKTTVKVNKKPNRMRRKNAPWSHSGIVSGNDDQKPKPTNDQPESRENDGINEQNMKNENVENSEDRISHLKGKKKKKMAKKDSQKVVTNGINKPGPSKKGKSSKTIDSMGMIFMCSSETKKDCYRYKVLGLPAGKKDMVLKICKGMRLFLFDVELRMMYGIYKAAGPGGYNIEPRAFKSQFPSQVRFTVLEDCLPLPEKFKKVLKDNYYTKKKFNFQLTSEQMKNLSKLFHESSKKAEPKQAVSGRRAAPSSYARRDKKRKRVEDDRRVERERSRRRAQEEPRCVPVVVDERYHQRPIVYERETYPSSLYQPLPAHNPPPTRSYSYDRPFGRDCYRSDSIVDHLDPGLLSSRELRLTVERSHHDPYVSYQEHQIYREPAYAATGGRREHYDYLGDGRYVEYYRPAKCRVPPPLYRRY